jgi:gas vesicle protein
MSDSDSGIGAFFAGVLIGGLVGAATALLMAPQSGEETRATLGRYGNDFRDRAQDSLEDARERAEATVADARRRAERIVEEARERAERIARETRDRRGKGDKAGSSDLDSFTGSVETATGDA